MQDKKLDALYSPGVCYNPPLKDTNKCPTCKYYNIANCQIKNKYKKEKK